MRRGGPAGRAHLARRLRPDFADLAPLLAGDGEPDFEALAAVQARHVLTMEPATIGPLSERFGLRA